MAEAFGMRDRVCYSSFNRLSMEKIHLIDPEAKVGLMYAEKAVVMPAFAKNLGLTALHPSFINLISPRFMDACRNYGIDVNVWTIDTPEKMRVCFKAGVNAVITNYPDRARKILASRL